MMSVRLGFFFKPIVWTAMLLPAAVPARADVLADVPVAAKTVRDDVYPPATVRFPDGVVSRPNVVYSEIRGYRPLQLDLYAPGDASGGAARPLVIWIHGGGWSRGDSRTSGAFADFPGVLAKLASRGYVVASVNYRLSSEAPFPAQIQDVKAAIRYLRTHAARLNIDPARVLLWGGSAGGQLAALAATGCGIAALEAGAAASRPSDCVQAAVVWYGIFDIGALVAAETRIAPAIVTAALGCVPRDCPERVALASPQTHVDATDPPMLLMHGAVDKEVPMKQSEDMAARLRAAGVPVQTLFIPGADHGWLGATPEATRAASLAALQRTFEFIDATFKR